MVADFEVGLELLEARPGRLELGVGDADLTRASTGASAVQQRQHVRVAVDVAQVKLHAPAVNNPSIRCKYVRLITSNYYYLLLSGRIACTQCIDSA